MSQINTIYPLIAANNNCKTKPYEPSFKSVLPQFVESQELCSKQASKAISEQIKVLIDLNSQEHFLDKNLTVAKVQDNISALYDLSQQIAKSQSLSHMTTFEDLCDSYFQGLKHGFDIHLESKKIGKCISSLDKFASNPANKNIFEKIGDDLLMGIIFMGSDDVSKFEKNTLNNYTKLFNNTVFEKFLEKISPELIIKNLTEDKNSNIVSKNIDILTKKLALPEYAFISALEKPDIDIINFNGDLNKLLDLLKSYNDRLRPSEKLDFVIDPQANEAVIAIKDEIGKDFYNKRVFVYDSHFNMLSTEGSTFGVNKDNIRTQNTNLKDLRKNTTYQIHHFYDPKTQKWILDSQIKEEKDAAGKMISREFIKLSGVEGTYNIKVMDSKGRLHTTSFAYKKPDGSVYIEKNLKSPQGIMTRVRYKNKPDKNGDIQAQIMDYVIYDKDGNELAKRESALSRLNNLCTTSSVNGKVHKVYTNNDKIRVVNESTGKITQIDLNEIIKDSDRELKEFFKGLCGATLEELNDTVHSVYKASPLESSCTYEARRLDVAPDEFILHHEKGHLLSHKNGNSFVSNGFRNISFFDSNKNNFSSDKKLMKIFQEEKQEYLNSLPRRIRLYAAYFINEYLHDVKNGGLEEVVAETEALINTAKAPLWVLKRAHQLQENFPKTIAYIIKHRG